MEYFDSMNQWSNIIVSRDNLEIKNKIREIIVNNFDINQTSPLHGYTLLMIAVKTFDYNLVEFICKLCCNVNVKDKFGKTVLFHLLDLISNDNRLSARCILSLFIDNGIDLTIQYQGKSYLETAFDNRYYELTRILIENNVGQFTIKFPHPYHIHCSIYESDGDMICIFDFIFSKNQVPIREIINFISYPTIERQVVIEYLKNYLDFRIHIDILYINPNLFDLQVKFLSCIKPRIKNIIISEIRGSFLKYGKFDIDNKFDGNQKYFYDFLLRYSKVQGFEYLTKKNDVEEYNFECLQQGNTSDPINYKLKDPEIKVKDLYSMLDKFNLSINLKRRIFNSYRFDMTISEIYDRLFNFGNKVSINVLEFNFKVLRSVIDFFGYLLDLEREGGLSEVQFNELFEPNSNQIFDSEPDFNNFSSIGDLLMKYVKFHQCIFYKKLKMIYHTQIEFIKIILEYRIQILSAIKKILEKSEPRN